jgi:transposase-like protein
LSKSVDRDARTIFQDAKTKVVLAKAVIHDGLNCYNEAFQKELTPRIKKDRSISVRNQGSNSVVERMQGTIRDMEKVMRDIQNKESAQKVIEADSL